MTVKTLMRERGWPGWCGVLGAGPVLEFIMINMQTETAESPESQEASLAWPGLAALLAGETFLLSPPVCPGRGEGRSDWESPGLRDWSAVRPTTASYSQPGQREVRASPRNNIERGRLG